LPLTSNVPKPAPKRNVLPYRPPTDAVPEPIKAKTAPGSWFFCYLTDNFVPSLMDFLQNRPRSNLQIFCEWKASDDPSVSRFVYSISFVRLCAEILTLERLFRLLVLCLKNTAVSMISG
jgi:hypothetical protein